MFGWLPLKSLTTFWSLVSSAGETCQPFNVTVVTFGAAARSVMACDPAASTDATTTTASRAGNISLLRMLSPPRLLTPVAPEQTPSSVLGALLHPPFQKGIQDTVTTPRKRLLDLA